jgi:hypothetical protein
MNNLDLLKVYHFDPKFRCGNNYDGGYVLGNLNGGYDCYISAGVSDDESFSRDFIKKYNMNEYNSFAFDGTIKSYPYHHTKNISFINKNINTFDDNDNSNLSFLMNKYNNIFLKMDIEGAEYPWLLSLNNDQLNKFKQIVIEFHGITLNNDIIDKFIDENIKLDLNGVTLNDEELHKFKKIAFNQMTTNNGWWSNYNDKMKCFEKLSNTHYIIHAHGNNSGCPVVNNIPDVLELTYVNKNYFTDVPPLNTIPLPIPDLDFRNNIEKNEIDLHCYPFVHPNP